jgi:hypothetical protein
MTDYTSPETPEEVTGHLLADLPPVMPDPAWVEGFGLLDGLQPPGRNVGRKEVIFAGEVVRVTRTSPDVYLYEVGDHIQCRHEDAIDLARELHRAINLVQDSPR